MMTSGDYVTVSGSYSTEPTVTTASSRKVAKKKKRETKKTATTDSGSAITPTPHYTAFDTALQNRSKEERLMLDVEVCFTNKQTYTLTNNKQTKEINMFSVLIFDSCPSGGLTLSPM